MRAILFVGILYLGVELSHAVRAMDAGLIDIPLVKLNRYHNIGNDNYFDEPTTSSFPGCVNLGNSWYIMEGATQTSEPTYNLFRLYSNSQLDHMSSPDPNEGAALGYYNSGQLGKTIGTPYIDMGLFPMIRWYKLKPSSKYDFITARNNESIPGYTSQGSIGNGWPNGTGIGTVSSISNSGVVIGTSYNWGGAIVSLKIGGIEQINKWTGAPAGRLLQSAMVYGFNNPRDNPTEAGDFWSNGSPVINYDIGGLVSNRIWTRVNAMQWGVDLDYNPFPNYATANRPILSGSEIEKKVTLENAHRIRYETTFLHGKAPGDVNSTVQKVWHEPVSLHLVQGYYNRIRIYEFDNGSWVQRLDTSALVERPDQINYEGVTNNRHMIVALNTTGTGSMPNKGIAIFVRNPTAWTSQGTGTSFAYVTRDIDSGESFNENSDKTLKLAYFENGLTFSKGQSISYPNSYLLMGTLTEILTEANSIP